MVVVKLVTIERWYSSDGKTFWYWIVDKNNEGIDGFTKKPLALDAIRRWGLTSINKSIKDKNKSDINELGYSVYMLN